MYYKIKTKLTDKEKKGVYIKARIIWTSSKNFCHPKLGNLLLTHIMYSIKNCLTIYTKAMMKVISQRMIIAIDQQPLDPSSARLV